MKEYEVNSDIRMMKGSGLSIAVEILLVMLLTLMPFAFHARKALIYGGQGLTWNWIHVPLGLFVYILVIQVISSPLRLADRIFPKIATYRQRLAEQHPSTKRP